MLTPAKLQRLWQTARYRQLMRETLSGRPEASLDLEARCAGPVAAAALALLRLGELNQTAQPVANELIERLLLSQCRDGSFCDTFENAEARPVLTALVLRALCALPGGGITVPELAPVGLGMAGLGSDRRAGDERIRRAVVEGVAYLSRAQLPEGGWGTDPLTRPFVTGFVLLQLGRLAAFRQAVRLEDALAVGESLEPAESRDAGLRQVWNLVRARCGRTGLIRQRLDEPRFVFADVA